MTYATPTREEGGIRTLFGLPTTMIPPTVISAFDQFAFWGMLTILVFYISTPAADGGIGLPLAVAFAISSAYAGSVYLLTLVAAWIADRVVGSEGVLRWGAVLAILGYAVLAFMPGIPGLTLGLVAVILGSAGMFVNEGTLVGGALESFETKRDAGFTVYYLASAAGAFVGITLMGVVQAAFGFHIAFAASAVGLAIGLAIYLPFRKATAEIAPKVDESLRASGTRLVVPLVVVAAALVAAIFAVSTGFDPALIVAAVSAVLAVVYFTRFFTSRDVTPAEKAGIVRYLPFFFATLVFCALYQQLFTTIAVHSEAGTDRFIFGFEIPPTAVLGIAPLCTILVAPLLAILWGKLGPKQPSASVKYAIAFAVIALALGLLAMAAATGSLTPIATLMFIVFVFGASDVVISPTGISMATGVAPKRFQTQMLSVHFIGVAVGTASSGLMAQAFVPGENETTYFFGLAAVALAVVVAMVVSRLAFGRRVIDVVETVGA
ncbi:peptide MFS transporter [Leifsonia sp. YAF41]|uniref:peptide MFS transporter n=1 Tax=Leifsonia sp. YAF41 TaxID=3233086 RepID=UPI003F9D4A2E